LNELSFEKVQNFCPMLTLLSLIVAITKRSLTPHMTWTTFCPPHLTFINFSLLLSFCANEVSQPFLLLLFSICFHVVFQHFRCFPYLVARFPNNGSVSLSLSLLLPIFFLIFSSVDGALRAGSPATSIVSYR